MAKTGQNIEAVVFFHPGEFLGEKMDEMGISEKDFSKLSGISEEKVHLINKCKADVDFDTATALEKATLIPTHFWLKLQDDYNIYRIRLLAESLTNSIKRPAENDVFPPPQKIFPLLPYIINNQHLTVYRFSLKK